MPKPSPEEKPYILGIDIGTNSIGWALVECTKNLKPTGLLTGQGPATGVRVFAAGTEDNIASGRDKSRNMARRDARMRRRMLWRRTRRLKRVFGLLQRAGLLPSGLSRTPSERHVLLENLDAMLIPRHTDGQRATAHTWLYRIRAQALAEPLPAHALGRALYHLAQRRGFKSNRREEAVPDAKKEEELGVVKQAIQSLEAELNGRTLGEFFASLDPEDRRIRKQRTSRRMYEDEFARIWNAQAHHHPAILTAELRRILRRALFFQRPLKLQPSLVGSCELARGRKRAPLALPECQRFRLLQRVNDLQIVQGFDKRPLSDAERTLLVEALEQKGDHRFTEIRKLLGLPRTAKFNLEEGGEEKLVGNRTMSKARKAFGPRWDALNVHEQQLVIEELRGLGDDALRRRGRARWKLEGEALEAFCKIALEDGHLALSREAVRKLLPRLERGEAYATARKAEYPQSFVAGTGMELLPPVKDAVPELRNPVVSRALTELRKVVNAIVRRHGKPQCIRVELARDLKKPRLVRQEIWKRNRNREKEREQAAERVVREAGIKNPKPADVLKVMLAEECGWRCPYTDQSISIQSLLGDHPKFDIEHIIPFPRSLDDSFLNKTLCYAPENARKGKRAPTEAYNDASLAEIMQRVARFKSQVRGEKLRRFKMSTAEIKERFGDFTNRQLADTAYAARLATKFLGHLYGGKVDAEHTQRVQVGAGQITAFLRNEWELNAILSDGPGKSREDHRHHAVDAFCVALTSPATLKQLSEASERAVLEKRRLFGRIEPTWKSLPEDLRASVLDIVVSHRPNRRISGALHKETIYSPAVIERDKDGKELRFHRVRANLESLTPGDLEAIADEKVKKAVLDKLKELGGLPPKDAFKEPKDHPILKGGDGRKVPIHKVRLKVKMHAHPIGGGETLRHADLGSNHHVEVIETTNAKGAPTWEGVIVTMLEAFQRKARKQSVIQRDHGTGRKFLFSLAGGDTIELTADNGRRCRLLVGSIYRHGNSTRLEMKFIQDARVGGSGATMPAKFVKEFPIQGMGRDFIVKNLEQLRNFKMTKANVTSLGEVEQAHD